MKVGESRADDLVSGGHCLDSDGHCLVSDGRSSPEVNHPSPVTSYACSAVFSSVFSLHLAFRSSLLLDGRF
ncbi:hypothetical protein LWI28_028372 [Acer negundo]|uniref:Uncharacterized protein n=1 Tax=Acer negundo TaxID=4023 RepID=A0AAD5NYU6_ACENE|nr:hypothetical protein LWI28_028372 [Acer negundo]